MRSTPFMFHSASEMDQVRLTLHYKLKLAKKAGNTRKVKRIEDRLEILEYQYKRRFLDV